MSSLANAHLTASPSRYVALQTVYVSKARADEAAFAAHVTALHEELVMGGATAAAASSGGEGAEGDEAAAAAAGAAAVAPPDAELVRRFCKNARFLRVLRPRSLEDELGGGGSDGGADGADGAVAAASASFDEDYALAGAVNDDLDMTGALARFEEAWREEQQEEQELSDEAAAALIPPEALVAAAYGRCQSPALFYIGLRAADAVAETRDGEALPGAGEGHDATALEAEAAAVHAAAMALFGGVSSLAEVRVDDKRPLPALLLASRLAVSPLTCPLLLALSSHARSCDRRLGPAQVHARPRARDGALRRR